MKHQLLAAFTATACTLGAAAQSVTVTSADGIKHKFAADRVKEITFIKTSAPDPDDNVFSAVTARAYSSGAIEATFSDPENPKSLTLWLVGPSMAKYLHDGVYTAQAEYGEMTVDTDKSYSFVSEGGVNTALQSGTVTVAIAGKIYTMTFDLTLIDGNSFKGSYTGAMPGLTGRDATLNTCETPQVKTNDRDDRVEGEYYIKMNDSDWSYEMAVDFYALAGTAKLPAGTYRYGSDNAAGTFGPKSYINTYTPSSNYRFAEGSTVEVSYEGEIITMAFNLVTGDGRKFDMTYSGEITFPPFEAPKTQLASMEIDGLYSGGKNRGLIFKTADESLSIVLDMYGEKTFIEEGTYTVAASEGLRIDTNPSYTYVKQGETTTGLQSGTVAVSTSDRTYTFDMALVLADGTPLNAVYTGVVGGFASKDFDLILAKPTIGSVNDQQPGEHIIKINDAGYTFEGRLDIFSDVNSTRPAAGTYTFSASKTPGTLGTLTQIDTFSPNNYFTAQEGSFVTIAYEGSNLVLTGTLNLEEGRKATLSYSGPHDYPEESAKETIDLNTCQAPKIIDNNGRVDGEFYVKMNDASWNYDMAIDFFAEASATAIPAGTYTYSAENTPGTFGPKSYIDLYTPNLGSSLRFAEGSTVEVSYDGDNITMAFSLNLAEQDKVLKMTYTGPINSEL